LPDETMLMVMNFVAKNGSVIISYYLIVKISVKLD